jgi:transcriptional regulator with XRE-family HTH domain
MSDFKKQVRIELIHKGMTMKDLADEMGISVSYLSELLNGTRTNQAQLDKIKYLLDIDEDEKE